MNKQERRLLGQTLYELRKVNPQSIPSFETRDALGRATATLAVVLGSAAQPPIDPCPLCGAPRRYGRRRQE